MSDDDQKNIVDLNEARKTIGQRKKAQSKYQFNRQGASSETEEKSSFLSSKIGGYIQFFLFLLLLGYLMRQCQ